MTDNDNPALWTRDERNLLDGLLDTIIPANDRLPAAGALGVGDFLARRVVDTPELGGLIAQGLAQAAALVEGRGSGEFHTLSVDDREAVARELEASAPAFFKTLVLHTYMGYYTHPAIPPRYGLPDHPPQTQGNDLPSDHPDMLAEMLEGVRSRGKVYREC